jgi:hypothetical protein
VLPPGFTSDPSEKSLKRVDGEAARRTKDAEMEKRELTTLASILAIIFVAFAILAVGFQQSTICWHCLQPMPLDFEEISERHDGSRVLYKRWRCPKCRRTTESAKDQLW